MRAFGPVVACLLAAGLPGCAASGLVEGLGVVDSYRMADRGPMQIPVAHTPVAYWLSLKAAPDAPGCKDVLLYVEVGPYAPLDVDPTIPEGVESPTTQPAAYGTAHEPCIDRYLLRGRKLRYRGAAVAASGGTPAYVDTSVEGGKLEIVFDAAPARTLSDMVVGKWVAFDGVIEPRAGWMTRFQREREYQTWHLIVTLPGGETVDIGDWFLVESRDFRKCLAIMRQKRAVRVRIVGLVQDAAPIKERAVAKNFVGTPRDVRGKVVVSAEQLEILGSEPAGEVRGGEGRN